MRSAAATLPRLIALVAQFITFVGFVVITAGLAKLQKKTNDLRDGTRVGNAAGLRDPYVQTFQSALLTPYPDDHGFQFSFIWFIIFFQFTLLFFTLAVSLIPGLLHTGRLAALTLLAVAMTLTINVVNNLTYLHKSDVARLVYGKKDINVTFAGSLLVVLGNAFTVLSLGIGAPHAAATTSYPATTTAKREAEVAAV